MNIVTYIRPVRNLRGVQGFKRVGLALVHNDVICFTFRPEVTEAQALEVIALADANRVHESDLLARSLAAI